MLKAFELLFVRAPAEPNGAAMAVGLRPSGSHVPSRWLAALSKDPREIVIRLADESHGALIAGTKVRQPADESFLRAQRRRWGGFLSATIQVPLHRCLVRELTIPKAALANADEVLALDLVRTTPFRPDAVLTGWYCAEPKADGDQVTIHQVVLKRAVVGGTIDQLARLRIPLRSIVVEAADGRKLPVDLLQPAAQQRAPVSVATSGLLKALLAAVLAANVAALGLTAYNLKTATATAESDLQTATSEAQALRRKVGEAQATASLNRQPRLRKAGSQPLVAVWEELSRVLPQGTSLAELRIEGLAVQLDGHSSNASELVGLLAASPMFSNVAFASPVTRDLQRGSERFQIKLTIGRLDQASPAPETVK